VWGPIVSVTKERGAWSRFPRPAHVAQEEKGNRLGSARPKQREGEEQADLAAQAK
jgi:hypothetical protein